MKRLLPNFKLCIHAESEEHAHRTGGSCSKLSCGRAQTDTATGCDAAITSYSQKTCKEAYAQVLELASLALGTSKWSASSCGSCLSGTHWQMCMVPE
jgi:hypothetical protein